MSTISILTETIYEKYIGFITYYPIISYLFEDLVNDTDVSTIAAKILALDDMNVQ